MAGKLSLLPCICVILLVTQVYQGILKFALMTKLNFNRYDAFVNTTLTRIDYRFVHKFYLHQEAHQDHWQCQGLGENVHCTKDLARY